MRKKYIEGFICRNKRGIEVTLLEKLSRNRWRAKVNTTLDEFVLNQSQIVGAEFKTPVCRTVYGVGYLGSGKYHCRDSDGIMSKEYSVWANMIKRCFTDYDGEKSRTLYQDVLVCEDWLNFQNFAEWYSNATVKYIQNSIIPKLDKDLLGLKQYSPEACVILPNVINCSLSESRNTSKICHGVRAKDYKFTASIMENGLNKNLGTFDNVEDAIRIYIEHKEVILHNLAEQYKYVLEDRAYIALSNWKHSGEYKCQKQ